MKEISIYNEQIISIKTELLSGESLPQKSINWHNGITHLLQNRQLCKKVAWIKAMEAFMPLTLTIYNNRLALLGLTINYS